MAHIVNGLTLYRISFRRSARAKKVMTWDRFAVDAKAARYAVFNPLFEQYGGNVIIESVEEAPEPK